MHSLDTNVLVRFLVSDDEQQAKQVYRLFQQLEKNGEKALVTAVVVLELCWVLKSRYSFSRAEVIEAIDDLLLLPILKFEHETAIQNFLLEAQVVNADLPDLLIAHVSNVLGSDGVWTFDRKALRCELFLPVP